MTARQIKKALQEAGIDPNSKNFLSIEKNEVEVWVTDEDGRDDYDKTESFKLKVLIALGNWGGFRCGYGGWVLRKDFRIDEYARLDYCDTSNSIHW